MSIKMTQSDKTRDDAPPSGFTARQSPSHIVRTFLDAMERRDLAASNRMLADNFKMVFPGNTSFRRLEDLVAWAATRYLSVTKTIVDIVEIHESDRSIVFCWGTLEGRWPDGASFAGIRFIDRFEIRAGKLVDQQVWNDLAEMRPPASVTPGS